jgi:ubiquinone/menaquinone biosynthesis C-methylase UbiE
MEVEKAMTARPTYDASRNNISLEAEIKRLYYQANMNVRKESRMLKAFGLKDGMSLLEVGSGTGCVTQWLSALVPNGSITGIDIDPILVDYARQSLEGKTQCDCRFVEGDVMQMDFPDETFDFAYVRLVFVFVSDPISAAKEIMRVLKPGGRLVLAEGDYAFNSISNPIVSEAEEIREKIGRFKGGRDTSARRAWHVLKSAGFQNIDLEAVVFHSGEKGLDWFYPQFDPGRVKALIKLGVVSEEDYDAYCAAVDRFQTSEEAFFMRILLMACGEKAQLA